MGQTCDETVFHCVGQTCDETVFYCVGQTCDETVFYCVGQTCDETLFYRVGKCLGRRGAGSLDTPNTIHTQCSSHPKIEACIATDNCQGEAKG